MVDSAASTLTFRSHPVYVAPVPFTTLATTINDSIETIVLTDASNFPTTGTIQIGTELIDYVSIATNTLTCTSGRGAHSTSPAAHTAGDRVDSVRWAIRQDQVSGYRMMDVATDAAGSSLSIADFANYPKRHNNINPPSQVSIYKT